MKIPTYLATILGAFAMITLSSQTSSFDSSSWEKPSQNELKKNLMSYSIMSLRKTARREPSKTLIGITKPKGSMSILSAASLFFHPPTNMTPALGGLLLPSH